ncbi:MAG TPA: hypothetical protein PLW65_21800 [Pseudomonadota bacterium]|nr:hypothetical protein [Pseudomonadota bacterium]
MKERVTKKKVAAQMYEKGMNVATIAELLKSEPSYIANALIEQGYVPNYMDLYTSTGPQNEHAALLAGVLRFRDLESARSSVAQIERLYGQFVAAKDRRGMHQCQVLALVGKNRAEGVGKLAEARVFTEWLQTRLQPTAAATATGSAAKGAATAT